jgi:hypothetical protein
MRQVRLTKLGIEAIVIGLGALASAGVSAQDVIAPADGVNMWDGQWHFGATIYGWVPWINSTVQLPPVAGGANTTIETQPSQYLKSLDGGVLLQGTVRKGDWSIWTDFVYLHMSNGSSHIRQIGLPGGDPTVPVSVDLNFGVKAAIWTFAPSYTVVRNDLGTLDVMVGFRYSSISITQNYVLSVPPLALTRAGGFSPSADGTDGVVGIRGGVRLSSDGKWFLPYETDFGVGNKNWQWNAMLGVGYHFHWGDVTLGGRNLAYHRTGNQALQDERFTGPALGATFRW